MNLTQQIVSADLPTRSRLPMQPLWITIHETANPSKGSDAEMHARYVVSPAAVDRTVLWHATVDDDSIVQHLPWNEVGWHAGDGYDGDGNRKSIGLELCVNSDADFAKTQRQAAQLVAHLVKTIPSLKPFPECLVQHNRWSGKNCPAQIRAWGTWQAFVAMCQEEINLAAGAPVIRVDGIFVDMNARLEGGKTRVDLRALAEALGCEVTWIPPEQGGPAVNITLPRPLAQIPERSEP